MHRRLVRFLALGLILALPALAQVSSSDLGPRTSDLESPTSDSSLPTSAAPPSSDPLTPVSVPLSPDSSPKIYPVGSEPQPEPSPVRWEGQTAILGAVRLDSATKTVTATGWVNQTAGTIEVLACGLAGKVHESVFVVPLNALDLQAALLLAGLKGGDPMPAIGQGPPQGSPVDIFVDWQSDGEPKTARAESFVWNVETDSVLPDAPWTFTGSMIKEGQFKAFAEESFVVTYWDPYAIVNVAHPAGANDELLVVNTNLVPEVKTPVALRFVPR
ncbi:MAG: hypothetical protein EOL90_10310 [Spartobacteria bacterium]|nr:hypothetical protein [Spartobacteria bacterium]